MAWVTPKTWVLGSLVAAADLNEQIRDNFQHLKIAVGDDGRIPALSGTYISNLSGANITGVAKTGLGNAFTSGVQNFNAGSGTRLILPTGVDKWA